MAAFKDRWAICRNYEQRGRYIKILIYEEKRLFTRNEVATAFLKILSTLTGCHFNFVNIDLYHFHHGLHYPPGLFLVFTLQQSQ